MWCCFISDGNYKQENGVIIRCDQGENHSKDGTIYKGYWENDRMNGQGMEMATASILMQPFLINR